MSVTDAPTKRPERPAVVVVHMPEHDAWRPVAEIARRVVEDARRLREGTDDA